MWLCGLSHVAKQEMSEEERQALERKLTSIEEDHTWKTVCNVNALILLTVNVFLWGYFAWMYYKVLNGTFFCKKLTNIDEKHI